MNVFKQQKHNRALNLCSIFFIEIAPEKTGVMIGHS